MEYLDLGHNPKLTDAGIAELARLPSLKRLSLADDNLLTSAALKALPLLLPAGGAMLGNRSDAARIIPLAAASGGTLPAGTGRGLDAYRSRPIPLIAVR